MLEIFLRNACPRVCTVIQWWKSVLLFRWKWRRKLWVRCVCCKQMKVQNPHSGSSIQQAHANKHLAFSCLDILWILNFAWDQVGPSPSLWSEVKLCNAWCCACVRVQTCGVMLLSWVSAMRHSARLLILYQRGACAFSPLTKEKAAGFQPVSRCAMSRTEKGYWN